MDEVSASELSARVLDEALKLAHELAELSARALQDTKRASNLHLERAFRGVLEDLISAEPEAMNSADHLEQVQKFLEADFSVEGEDRAGQHRHVVVTFRVTKGVESAIMVVIHAPHTRITIIEGSRPTGRENFHGAV